MTGEDFGLYTDLKRIADVDLAIKQYIRQPKIHIVETLRADNFSEEEQRSICRCVRAEETDFDSDLPLCRLCERAARRRLQKAAG